jgi:hypothetical protein
MTNVQLYFAIGVPTFTILVSLVIGIFQLNHAVNQINARFTTLENLVTGLETDWMPVWLLLKRISRRSSELSGILIRDLPTWKSEPPGKSC